MLNMVTIFLPDFIRMGLYEEEINQDRRNNDLPERERKNKAINN